MSSFTADSLHLLSATFLHFITDVDIYSEIHHKKIRIKSDMNRNTDKHTSLNLALEIRLPLESQPPNCSTAGFLKIIYDALQVRTLWTAP